MHDNQGLTLASAQIMNVELADFSVFAAKWIDADLWLLLYKYRPGRTWPVLTMLILRQGLSAQSYFVVASAAVDRSVLARPEGYFSLFAAIGANSGEHFTPARKAGFTLGCLFCLTASWATLGFMLVTSGCECFLFGCREDKGLATV